MAGALTVRSEPKGQVSREPGVMACGQPFMLAGLDKHFQGVVFCLVNGTTNAQDIPFIADRIVFEFLLVILAGRMINLFYYLV